ncbi:MAG: acyl carrier protein [Cyanobacteria bacterium]|jgi:acyl carrier protein|nr:acyl carrier protein [Cyanobacteria bacterium GSL.Bin21]
MSEQANTLLTREEIQAKVIEALESMTADWDLDLEEGINAETRLMEDMAFESIDVVQLVVALEQRLNRKNIPFEHLFMEEGDYVDDLVVSEIVEFLEAELKKPYA